MRMDISAQHLRVKIGDQRTASLFCNRYKRKTTVVDECEHLLLVTIRQRLVTAWVIGEDINCSARR